MKYYLHNYWFKIWHSAFLQTMRNILMIPIEILMIYGTFAHIFWQVMSRRRYRAKVEDLVSK